MDLQLAIIKDRGYFGGASHLNNGNDFLFISKNIYNIRLINFQQAFQHF